MQNAEFEGENTIFIDILILRIKIKLLGLGLLESYFFSRQVQTERRAYGQQTWKNTPAGAEARQIYGRGV